MKEVLKQNLTPGMGPTNLDFDKIKGMLLDRELKIITVREVKGSSVSIVLSNGVRIVVKLNLSAEILSKESFTIIRIESSPIESSLKVFMDKDRPWKPLMVGSDS